MIERIDIGHEKTCDCKPNHLNCMSPKDWIKAQLGVWQFNYEKRDIRDKKIHPATFPVRMAERVIELFTHKGELVLDPFVGVGTTSLAAKDLERNSVGFDINQKYIDVAKDRVSQQKLINKTKTAVICDDAINIEKYLKPKTVKVIFTSPPYANLLNRKRLNKSRRGAGRKNDQFMKIEQYSQNPRDLGTMRIEDYDKAMTEIFSRLKPLLKPGSHCVINVPDMYWEGKRIPIHIHITHALEDAGYELKNIIIWDRTNIVNRIGIFGWPSNYITMGTTFEYLLDFIKK